MTISFNAIPSNLRIPFVAVEFDSSRSAQGPALLAYRALIIGQKIAAGTATANTLYRVTSPEDVITLGGRGSMLHRQAVAWFGVNRFTETWIGVLDDDGGAVAATADIVVSGTATAAGSIALYVAGRRIPVAVASGDASTDVAAAIEAAIDADLDLPATASVASSTVTVTARNGGTTGNGIDIRHSYLPGESLPAGISLAIGTMGSGATDPTLTTLIAALGDTWYNIIAHPYTDATSLSAIESELADRFGPLRMIDGLAVTSAIGSFSTLTTLGSGRNSPHSVIFAQPGINPVTWAPEHAAECAAQIAAYAPRDPARPFQTLPLSNSLPPAESDLFTNAERNLLLFDGIATSRVIAGAVQIERAITTYQTNAAGADDTAYLDATTMLTLMYLRYSFRQRLLTRYPRHKLASDGSRFGPGQAVMTPKLGQAEALGWFLDMELQGLVENYDQFKNDLVVERSTTDPNRLDILLPPDLINQLIVSAAQIQFRL